MENVIELNIAKKKIQILRVLVNKRKKNQYFHHLVIYYQGSQMKIRIKIKIKIFQMNKKINII